MLVFDSEIQGKKRDELTHEEWLKITRRINRIQPNVIELYPGVKVPRITHPAGWDGRGRVVLKPFLRPYCIELSPGRCHTYVVRIHKLKWNGHILQVHESVHSELELAIDEADKYLKIINQNWKNVVAEIAKDLGAIDFMVDSSFNYVKFRFTAPNGESVDASNAIRARRALASAFLPCLVKFSTNVWREDKGVEDVKVVFR